MKAAIDRLAKSTNGSPWVLDHDGTNAVWTGEAARPGITRIEVRATHAPGNP